MSYELVINSSSDEVVTALLYDNKLVEIHKEGLDDRFNVGDVYLGKVKKIVPSLNAAFVDVGYEKDAFLHYFDLGPQYRSMSKFTKDSISGKQSTHKLGYNKIEPDILKDGKIKEHLSSNQIIAVQVTKEPISSKGPRLSAEVTIPGRFLVLVPFSEKISVSQKIESREEKDRLKRLITSIRPKGFGVIIRTVAEGKKVAELDKDLQSLVDRWTAMCKKLQGAHHPSKVLSELNRGASMIRDVFNDQFSAIHIDDETLYLQIKDYVQEIAPGKESIVKFYESKIPMYEKHGIERQIKTSFGRTVSSSKGTYLVIEHTEALHVIDVNSGNRSNRSKSQEETAMEVNLIAASEIARQLRLRDMGGIIVVDFIDLNSNSNRKKLFEYLTNEMSTDRTKHKILPPSRFGLIQITRQRVRPEMNIKTKEPNPNVNGEIEAPIVIIDKINTELSKITKNKRNQKEQIHLHLHPFVAAYILSGNPSHRLKWYFEYKKWIRIVPRHAYQYLEFRFLNKDRRRLHI